MMISSIIGSLLAAITLHGVVGDRLSARAYFDANNVHVGDPMILTIDFVGSAEFQDLHPPALSREVDSKVWKIDDASAKTETFDIARRLVYRVRPLREGVIELPSLTFEYEMPGGGVVAQCSTRPIPVHVRPGIQAALAGLDESREDLPMPDGLIINVTSRSLGEDEAFQWRKACGKPTAEAFAKFSFVEARLNEAACHTIEGNWARAMKVYGSLEWQTGQTPTIERGIIAALARKTGDPKQELPAWRMAFGGILRHSWKGRVGIVAGVLLLLAAVFWVCGRAIRSLAAVAVVMLFSLQAGAQDIFEQMDRMMQQHFERVNAAFGPGSIGGMNIGGGMNIVINGQQQEPLEIVANVSLSTNDVRVGETFEFRVSLEAPKSVTLEQIQIAPSEMFGMVIVGKPENLPDGTSANPSNRVMRMSIPVRYDVPFKADMDFQITGMATRRTRTRFGSSQFSHNFAVSAPSIPVEIKPLPTDNQPADFNGMVGTGFRLSQSADVTRVATNDVVKVTTVLDFSGYVPLGAVPDEIGRRAGRQVAWQSYFVADSSPQIPAASIVYYDTDLRDYRRITSKPIKLSYIADETVASEAVAVDAGDGKKGVKTVPLHFAPSDNSPVVHVLQVGESDAPPVETERRGEWVRIDTGKHAGWTREL